MNEFKIAIGITTAGLIKSQTAFCLLNMLKGNYEILFKEGPNQPLNREVIAEIAIQKKCSHLLFVDSDMYFEKDALNTLLSRDKDIIGVNYHLRSLPPVTTVKINPEKQKTVMEDYPDGVIKCDAVATGFMLIKTPVFEKLAKPWYHVGQFENGELEGHDYRFCRIAREAGFDIWCDLNIKMGHIGDWIY